MDPITSAQKLQMARDIAKEDAGILAALEPIDGPTVTVSREQKIAAIQLALAFAYGDRKEIRYGAVQSALNRDEEEADNDPCIARMDEAIRTLFPNANVLDDVSTQDIGDIFEAVLRDFETHNELQSMID
jgi:hypothetical protein